MKNWPEHDINSDLHAIAQSLEQSHYARFYYPQFWHCYRQMDSKNEKIKTDRLMYGLSTLSTQWSSVYPIQHASTSTHSQNDGRSTVSEIHSINSAFIRIFYAICPICNRSAPKEARPIVRQCPEHTMRFWSDK